MSVNLFSVSDESSEIQPVDIISDIFEGKKIIHINKIPLNSNLLNNENSKEIEINIKEKIRKYLRSFVD